MANNTTTNQRRQPGRKAADIEQVWREMAPEAVFRKITLADYQAALALIEESHAELNRLTRVRAAATKVRDDAESALKDLTHRVIRGVAGHGDYGDDSPLYRAMGFVTKSERASGLTQKRKPADPPGDEETAA